jgi:hypothetical protein
MDFHLYIQWATDPAQGPVEVMSSDWVALPTKPEPRGGEVLDNQPGWVAMIEVQGCGFHWDHYAVVDYTEGVRVYGWDDDPEDWLGQFHGCIWTFRPLAKDVGPAPYRGYNTRQTHEWYAEGDILAKWQAHGFENGTIHEWSEFRPPPSRYVKHGIWVPDPLWVGHEAVAVRHDWRTWTEGVPAKDVVDGKVVLA